MHRLVEVIMKLSILPVISEIIEFVFPTHTSGFLKREAAEVMYVQNLKRIRKKSMNFDSFVSYLASVLQNKIYVSSFQISLFCINMFLSLLCVSV